MVLIVGLGPDGWRALHWSYATGIGALPPNYTSQLSWPIGNEGGMRMVHAKLAEMNKLAVFNEYPGKAAEITMVDWGGYVDAGPCNKAYIYVGLISCKSTG